MKLDRTLEIILRTLLFGKILIHYIQNRQTFVDSNKYLIKLMNLIVRNINLIFFKSSKQLYEGHSFMKQLNVYISNHIKTSMVNGTLTNLSPTLTFISI